MPTRLFFLIKVLIFSLFLFICWSYLAKVYSLILNFVVNLFYLLFKPEWRLQISSSSAYRVSLALIPFLALALATPKVKPLKKIRLIILGIILFLFFDLATTLLSIPQTAERSIDFKRSALYTVYRSLLIILPILFWLIPNYYELGKLFSPQAPKLPARQTKICPLCKEEKVGLAEHIRAVHGETALKSWWIRRHLRV